MNKIFCTNCGSKIEFEKIKPNFCFKCGESFNSFAKRKQQEVEPDEEELEDEEPFIAPRKNIRIDVELDKKEFTLADAVSNPTAPTGSDIPVRGRSGRKALTNLRNMFKKVGTDEE